MNSLLPRILRLCSLVPWYGLACLPAPGQEETTDTPKLTHDLPTGDYPEPKPPVLPPAVVLDGIEYVLPAQGRSIIVERIAPPPGLVPPDFTPPQPEPVAIPDDVSRQGNEEARKARLGQSRLCLFSCTVYDQKATHIRWTHEGKRFSAWSSINWNHLTGIGSFVSGDGRVTYAVILGIGNQTSSHRGKSGKVIPIPDFPEGEISWELLEGDPEDLSAQADLKAIHELYRSEGVRLRASYEERERKRLERVALLKANPPEPEDIVIRHWEIPTAKNQEDHGK